MYDGGAGLEFVDASASALPGLPFHHSCDPPFPAGRPSTASTLTPPNFFTIRAQPGRRRRATPRIPASAPESSSLAMKSAAHSRKAGAADQPDQAALLASRPSKRADLNLSHDRGHRHGRRHRPPRAAHRGKAVAPAHQALIGRALHGGLEQRP